MATTTITEFVTKTVVTASASASSTNRAASQGGILEGANPTVFDPKNPIVLFIIQAGIIIIFSRLLYWPLSKLRQPRVIAEVIGGILLGPSVMGRVPGFTNAIFPTASMSNLSLVANLGLVLFLFLVGLEVDLRFLVSNWRVALSVGAAGMALPFGLGCAIAWGLYEQFRNDPGTKHIAFPVYMLFVGVAMAITAFPVLCRILTDLKLLSTPVGVIVLSAGVGNDVVGWILLALCVALVNAGTGLTALWILLIAVAFTLFLVFAVRPAFIWILHRTRAIQDGPSQSIVALTLLMALTCAFFTAVIGVHPIFGAFLAGLICPHEGGFAIKVTEKVEDLISTLFLPLYFALSGLSTNLGLLNDGITWAYVVGVIATAFFGKVIGGSGAARLNGLVWRECFTIGALMSCKGLVELIVLNIGLQASILSQRTFTIFVVMALVTTFATTPLVAALYPPWYQQKLEAWKRGVIDWDTGARRSSSVDSHIDGDSYALAKHDSTRVRKILIHLRLDSMPGLLALIALCGGANEGLRTKETAQDAKQQRRQPQQPISAHGLRLIQLTERESSVMKVSELDEYSALDPVVNTFRAFGRLHNVAISGEVSIALESYFADMLTSRARETSSDLLLLPWSETGGMSESQVVSTEEAGQKMASRPYQEFVGRALRTATGNVGVFIDNGFGGVVRELPRRLSRTVSGLSMRHEVGTQGGIVPLQKHRLLVPYLGSGHDEIAVRFAVQLAYDARATIKIIHVRTGESASTIPAPSAKGVSETVHVATGFDAQTSFLDTVRGSLPSEIGARVAFESMTAQAESTAQSMEIVSSALNESGWETGDMVVIGRNADAESSGLGDLAEALIKNGCKASLLVMQGRQA